MPRGRGKRGPGKKPKLDRQDAIRVPSKTDPRKHFWKVRRLQPISESKLRALEAIDRFFGYMEGGKPLLRQSDALEKQILDTTEEKD